RQPGCDSDAAADALLRVLDLQPAAGGFDPGPADTRVSYLRGPDRHRHRAHLPLLQDTLAAAQAANGLDRGRHRSGRPADRIRPNADQDSSTLRWTTV